MKKHFVTAALSSGALVLSAAVASAAPTLNGSIAGDDYTLAAVQTTQTQFGDNLSELNAAYATVQNGTLYLTLTGQVENNFNKLNIFIDSQAGGQNTLENDTNNGGSNPTNDGWAFNYAGFTFDTGFDADFMLIARNGFGGTTDQFDLDFAVIGGGETAFESQSNVFGGSLTGSNPNALPMNGIGVGYDNSNTAGVMGGTDPADPVAAAAVQTGLELAIPLSAIGNPALGDTILISAHVNGSNHDFLSNQSLGGFTPPQANLGGNVGSINLNQFAGLQHFSVVIPEPTSLAFLGLGGLTLLRRRR